MGEWQPWIRREYDDDHYNRDCEGRYTLAEWAAGCFLLSGLIVLMAMALHGTCWIDRSAPWIVGR